MFPALFLTISSHLYDFSFYFAVGVVCLLLVCFAAQLMADVSTYTEKLSTNNDVEEANNYFFYSFIGTVVYGHGRYVLLLSCFHFSRSLSLASRFCYCIH